MSLQADLWWMRLLCDLKGLTEECLSTGILFGFRSTSPDNMLLTRQINSILAILRHGMDSNFDSDSRFLRVLGVLFPSEQYSGLNDAAWVRNCLISKTLGSNMRTIKGAFSRMCTFYRKEAFILQSGYFDAFLKCVDAIEQVNPIYLTAIDPSLTMLDESDGKLPLSPAVSISMADSAFASCEEESENDNESFELARQSKRMLDPPNTLPNIIPASPSQSTFNSPVSATALSSATMIRKPGSVLDSLAIGKVRHNSLPRSQSDSSVCSLGLHVSPLKIDSAQVIDAYDSPVRRLELSCEVRRGCLSVTPTPSSPTESEVTIGSGSGQYFFSSRFPFNKGEETLEVQRENSHFHMCEQVMAMVEKMKWRKASASICSHRTTATVPATDLPTLATTIPIDVPWPNVDDLFSPKCLSPVSCASPGFMDTGEFSSTSASVSDMYAASSSSELTLLSDERSDLNRSIDTFEDSASPVSHSVSGKSCKASGHRRQPSWLSADLSGNFGGEHSAESVAMFLLRKFSETQRLPHNGDMNWLVSDSDVPQSLLPFPSSLTIPPDEVWVEGLQQRINLRGSFEWAPPRPQIVLKVHPSPNFRKQIAAQNLKCAGCGIKLEKGYLKRVRYCEYYGKYFCLCCHMGSTSYVPARIIFNWDFRQFPVSDIARKFLEQQRSLPLFDLFAINPDLYRHVKALRNVLAIRHRLRFVWDYVRTCRLAENVLTKDGNLLELFTKVPSQLLTEVHMYSVEDFCATRDGSLARSLKILVDMGSAHVVGCASCKEKGFICEVCKKADDVLFPFQMTLVKRCDSCGACVHIKCAKKSDICSRCIRLREKAKTQQLEFGSSINSESPPSAECANVLP